MHGRDLPRSCEQQKDVRKEDDAEAEVSGKSRLCSEASMKIAELDAVKTCHANLSVCVTFLNGEQVTRKDEGLDGSVVLGLRVACALLPKLGLSSERTLDDFRIALGEYVELCSLQTVMCLFGAYLWRATAARVAYAGD